jgi:outer membrane protein assembly factor BamB
MANSNLVFAGIRGSVVAMDKSSGTRVWETKLKAAGFVTLLVEEGRVFAGTHGEIFCLDADTGKLLWQDGLKGYGFGLMTIATKNGCSDTAALVAEFVAEQQSSSSADSTAAAS